MYEVEVKVRAGVDAVRDELEAAGGDHLGGVRQVDTYYDHPVRRFGETDEALRVRREDGAARLTYKGPLVEEASKTREEVETPVDDADAVDAILRAVGFDPVATVEKKRDRYRFGGYTVALDRVEGLGEFVEVEAEGEEAEIERLRGGAYDLLSRLGLDPSEHIRASYLELLLGG